MMQWCKLFLYIPSGQAVLKGLGAPEAQLYFAKEYIGN